MKISPAISTNKKCHSHQQFLASKCKWGSNRCCPLSEGDCWGAGGMQEADICHSLRWKRRQDLAPDSWYAYERNEFSEPRGLHLSLHRLLISLTWYLIFLRIKWCVVSWAAVLILPPIKLNSQPSSCAYVLVDNLCIKRPVW